MGKGRRTGGAVGRDGAGADDAPAVALLDHLLGGGDVCVHEAEDVDADLVLDEPGTPLMLA